MGEDVQIRCVSAKYRLNNSIMWIYLPYFCILLSSVAYFCVKQRHHLVLVLAPFLKNLHVNNMFTVTSGKSL